jgi:hypothetical protein
MLSGQFAKLRETHQVRTKLCIVIQGGLHLFPPTFSDVFIFAPNAIEIESKQVQPRNDILQRTGKSHFHCGCVFALPFEIVVADLVTMNRFAILLLKNRSVIDATVVLAVCKFNSSNIQRDCSAHQFLRQ